jgi:hypothetical protein
MMNPPTKGYVSLVQDGVIKVVNNESACDGELRNLGGKPDVLSSHKWKLKYSQESDLAAILSTLRDMGFAFSGGTSGWPPAAVFEELRAKGVVKGRFIELTWAGKGRQIEVEK